MQQEAGIIFIHIGNCTGYGKAPHLGVPDGDVAGSFEEFHCLRGLSSEAHSAGREAAREMSGVPRDNETNSAPISQRQDAVGPHMEQEAPCKFGISRNGWCLLLQCLQHLPPFRSCSNMVHNREKHRVPAGVHLSVSVKWGEHKQD